MHRCTAVNSGPASLTFRLNRTKAPHPGQSERATISMSRCSSASRSPSSIARAIRSDHRLVHAGTIPRSMMSAHALRPDADAGPERRPPATARS